MFLNMTKTRNSKLIDTAFELHQNGLISPNTYVLDIDSIQKNVKALKSEADKYNISLLAMTKQIGRNPILGKYIADAGIDYFVAVDPWECEILAKNGLKIGNVGHLVQIPKNMIEKTLKFMPKYVTVYSFENAKLISDVAISMGIVQDVLLKINDDKNTSYPGQEGGIKVSELLQEVDKIQKLKGVKLVGLTSFPCVLYNSVNQAFAFTDKATALRSAKELLCKNGFDLNILNVPSANCVQTIKMISEYGGNLLEPGHALTGTTPIHAIDASQVEIPSIVYVSEVSHYDDDFAYIYGGGNYTRGNIRNAFSGNSLNNLKLFDVSFPPAENIDYYGKMALNNQICNVGDVVIMAFRTQIFVTRAHVCLVEGISNGNPKIIGIYDSQGNLL